MEVQELAKLINNKESPTLEFKGQLNIFHSEQKVKSSKRDELIKDILSLANGNAYTAGDPAYMIIGVADKVKEGEERELFGVSGRLPDEAELLDIINRACEPQIPNLKCDTVFYEGKQVFIITIPPSPYLHETTRELEADKQYTRHCVFIRHNQSIDIASAKEREVILASKKRYFHDSKKVSPVILGSLIGAIIGGYSMAVLANRILTIEQRQLIGFFTGAVVFGLLGGTIGQISSIYSDVKASWQQFTSKQKILISILVVFLIISFIIIGWKNHLGN